MKGLWVLIVLMVALFFSLPYHLYLRLLWKKNPKKSWKKARKYVSGFFKTELKISGCRVTVLGKENEPCDYKYDVTGGLCENNDKFAIDRMLPKVDNGDIMFIHDTGAHGFAMGYNYNGKLKSAELLYCEDSSVKMIRRAETVEDYFATLDNYWDV